MRVVFATLTGILSLFMGCSTISRNQNANLLTMLPKVDELAPGKDLESVDLYLQKLLAANPSEAMQWWTTFQQGRLWAETHPSRSCEKYLTLARELRFQLSQLALLRSLEVCPPETQGLMDLESALATTQIPWLEKMARRIVLERAKRLNDTRIELRLSEAVARDSSRQTEKIALLQRAIEISDSAEQKAELQLRLKKAAPRFNDHPRPDELLEVALDLRKAREFEKARATYRRAIQSNQINDLDRYRAYEGIRMAYKLEKKVDEYVAATFDLAKFARSVHERAPQNAVWLEKFHDSHTMLARTVWTEKTVPEALRVLSQLEADLKARRYPLTEVRWLQARIEEEAGRFDRAVEILKDIVAPKRDLSSVASRTLLEKIFWYKAWNLRKIGRHAEAIDVLRDLNKNYFQETSVTRNRFWMAKSLATLGQGEASRKEFQSLAEDDPLGYYGLLSYRELGQPFPPTLAPETESFGAPNEQQTSNSVASKLFKNPDDLATIEWLLSVSESQVARDFLNHFTSRTRLPAQETPERKELLKYYARAGHFYSLFAELSRVSPEARTRVLKSNPGLLFPQPFAQLVGDAGKRFGVLSELMFSIMRQESSFDPFARSPADAFGLMQLIPEAAARVEGVSGIRLSTPEDLYKPDINVVLGAAFLRNLLDQFDERFILTVASYNASERAVRGWMKTRFRGDSLEFIEDVPYEETRGYIKLVLRNFIFYLRLNSGGQPMPFPEWCLDSLHDFNS